MIILCLFTPDFRPLFELVGPYWREYCERHGYRMMFLEEDKIGQLAQYHYPFYKISRVLEIFKEEMPDAMSVVDLDILPTNMRIPMGAYVSSKHAITITNDINGLNCGVFQLNGFWSTKVELWLKTIVSLRDVTGSEQHAMQLIQEAYREDTFFYPHPSFNSIPYDKYDYGMKLPEDGQWAPGHFVCHLPGRTMEDRLRIFNEIIPQIVR